jgi:hypothetical protein
MDRRPESERIEIELTSNVVPADRSHHRLSDGMALDGGEVVVREPDDPPAGSTGSDQRRWFSAVAIVGVLGLLLGWLIGRAGGSDEIATTSESAPTTTLSTATTTTFLPGEVIPGVPATTTVTTPRPTTTLSTSMHPVELDPRVAGLDLTLIGVTMDGAVVELDLAEQTLLERELQLRNVDPGRMIVGDDWLLFAGQSGGHVLVRDGESESVDLGDPWQTVWIPGTDRFWRPSGGWGYGEPTIYSEVDLAGGPTGRVIEIPVGSWAQLADPRGGLVVEVSGKSYSVNESDAELIAPGDLLGLSLDLAVVRDCDVQLHCGVSVIDRATNEARVLELDPSLGESPVFEPMYGWGPAFLWQPSPDGRFCVVLVPSVGSTAFGLLDLISGDFTELGSNFFGPPAVVWSADSRFGFFLDDVGVQAYDRDSAEVFLVQQTTPGWISLGQRGS